jgi:hypothetical protein
MKSSRTFWLLAFLIASQAFLGMLRVQAAALATESTPAEREFSLKLEQYQLSTRQYELSRFGLAATAVAIAFGMFQYRKAEKWKRAEFLAREMRIFFDDPDVKNVLTMIDWAPRKINLFHAKDVEPKGWPAVTRALQISALRPHTLLVQDGGSDSESDGGNESAGRAGETLAEMRPSFTREEVRIRDGYDRFLDSLERFSSHLQSGLVTRQELNSYLKYWIDDMAAYTENSDDATWTCALFAYIEFYSFENVQKLFRAYGYNIAVSGKLFRDLGAVAQDSRIPRQLAEECQKVHMRYSKVVG